MWESLGGVERVRAVCVSLCLSVCGSGVKLSQSDTMKFASRVVCNGVAVCCPGNGDNPVHGAGSGDPSACPPHIPRLALGKTEGWLGKESVFWWWSMRAKRVEGEEVQVR